MTPLHVKAAMFSRAAHQAVGQKRKYTGEPYWHHPAAVAEILIRVPSITEQHLAAAYLHDVLEDTQVTFEDLNDMFGSITAGYVLDLTDQFTEPSHGNRAIRKALERKRLAACCPAVQTIKYADLIDNTSSIVQHDPGFAQIYLNEKRELLNVMTAGDHQLWMRAWGTLVEADVQVKEFMAEHRANTYKVYINGRHKKTVFTGRDAWEVVGQKPFGSRHEVYDADNKIRPQFVPY